MLSLQTISLRKPELASLYQHSCGWEGRGDLIRTHGGCVGCGAQYKNNRHWVCLESIGEEEFEQLDWITYDQSN